MGSVPDTLNDGARGVLASLQGDDDVEMDRVDDLGWGDGGDHRRLLAGAVRDGSGD